MAITVVASVKAQSTDNNAVTTAAIDTTGATHLFAVISEQLTGGAAPTDSKGNTWAPGPTNVIQNPGVTSWYVKNPVVGTGHTFTGGGTTTFPSIYVIASSSTDTAENLDQSNNGASAGGTVQPGSVTPTVDDEIVFTGLAISNGPSPTIDSGFTLAQGAASTATSYGGGVAYLIQTTAAAANPTWTSTASGNLASVVATFKPAAAGAAVTPILMRQYRARKN